MPQLHFSVDDDTAKLLSRHARKRGLSLSRYLAELVSAQVASEWPRGYLRDVVGSCAKSGLTEPEELVPDDVSL
jgi:hypothetical protein